MRLTVLAAIAAALTTPASLAQTCTVTPAQTEGPYYRTPNPETSFMRIGTDGPAFRLRGRVVDLNCNPIPWTWVALWHTDANGAYDNVAPFDRYRATYFTDANGEFAFDTIRPGLYPGRTRHAHVKVDAASTAMLTTQLYWPGEPGNASDNFYNPALLMTVTTQRDGTTEGFYEFRLPIAGACTGATITANPASITVEPGATATFTAAGAGSTTRTFRWYRDGELLANDGRISGATTSTLVISAVTVDDAGSYTCASLNSCGSQVSAAATLTVPAQCPADLDGNGEVAGSDLATRLATWGRCKACAADLDGNGEVDAADLAAMLASWGPCGG